MSFNGYTFGGHPLNQTVSERAQALRDQHDEVLRQARQTRGDDDMPKTPTGIKRASLRTDEATTAIGSLNQKLDSALDVVREAMLREREAKQAERAERSDDATRAPALGRDR